MELEKKRATIKWGPHVPHRNPRTQLLPQSLIQPHMANTFNTEIIIQMSKDFNINNVFSDLGTCSVH